MNELFLNHYQDEIYELNFRIGLNLYPSLAKAEFRTVFSMNGLKPIPIEWNKWNDYSE